MPIKKSKVKILLVTIAALLLISAIITMLMITKKTSTKPSRFFARDIDTAANSCEGEIVEEFGKKLLNKDYDNISSRYDASRHQYIIWYRITLRTENAEGRLEISDHMAKCTVWEVLGYVSEFHILDI